MSCLETIHRHCQGAMVIGRARHLQLSPHQAALAYWHGDYVAIDREEDMIRLADVSLPTGHAHETSAVARFSRLEG